MTDPHFNYQIRESARAKYMSLRVSVDRGLEVVVPRGFDRKLIPTFLRDKQMWVDESGIDAREKAIRDDQWMVNSKINWSSKTSQASFVLESTV